VPYFSVQEILEIAKERNEPPFVIVLDGVTDPHNLGAVLRSADAGGVHGVIIPKRRAVGLTGTVSKTSAGALSHVAVARVGNITRTLDELKEAGLWIACADMEGPSLFDADMSGAIALVLGAEGKAFRGLWRKIQISPSAFPCLGKLVL
jgi:23S rRNA (guanosine2251-2'-O)-methyltransferase